MGWSYLYYAQTHAKGSKSWTQANTNRWKYHMSGVPFVGDFIRAYDQNAYFNDYLNNRNIDWANIKYPSLNIGAGSYASAASNLAYGGAYAYVSKNLMSLYRNSYSRNPYYRGVEYL